MTDEEFETVLATLIFNNRPKYDYDNAAFADARRDAQRMIAALSVSDVPDTENKAAIEFILAALSASPPDIGEPVAWESTSVALTQYLSDSRYRKLRPTLQAWYRPYRCSQCTHTLNKDKNDD